MKLYNTTQGCVLEKDAEFYALGPGWPELIIRNDLEEHLRSLTASRPRQCVLSERDILPPIVSQEVWAAGVTYLRSRSARMEESKTAGGGSFYDRVYHAERPELFFKATPNRVVGHLGKVAIRKDATWSVPEPELALLISPNGRITGFTIGNDMSSRDIEGENPLYLPQAKVYHRCCGLGPGILVGPGPLPASTVIKLEVVRGGQTTFSGSTALSNMKRDPQTLVEYLFRDNSFPNGCFLLTGTGIIPPDSFALQQEDEIRITIEGIGTLVNFVG
jgi:2-dehydro-3-deoxy-D-arabinonate dehydratase